MDALALKAEKGNITRSILSHTQDWSKKLQSEATLETRSLVRTIVSRINIYSERIDLHLDKRALRAVLTSRRSDEQRANHGTEILKLAIEASLKRCGGEVRLVIPGRSGNYIPAHPVPSLIRTVMRGRDWYERIVRGEFTGPRSIARATGLDERYVRRILQCAFLAPDIVERIFEGRQPPHLTFKMLLRAIPMQWSAQRQVLGFS
jgi:site-specific DNA recombinase